MSNKSKKEDPPKDDKAAKDKVDLGLLEEDDEFEEFPAEGKLDTRCLLFPS